MSPRPPRHGLCRTPYLEDPGVGGEGTWHFKPVPHVCVVSLQGGRFDPTCDVMTMTRQHVDQITGRCGRTSTPRGGAGRIRARDEVTRRRRRRRAYPVCSVCQSAKPPVCRAVRQTWVAPSPTAASTHWLTLRPEAPNWPQHRVPSKHQSAPNQHGQQGHHGARAVGAGWGLEMGENGSMSKLPYRRGRRGWGGCRGSRCPARSRQTYRSRSGRT